MALSLLAPFSIDDELLNQRCFLVSQPVVPLACRETSAYHEMLIRYRDEDGEIHSPDSFFGEVAIGEELRQIDRWVVRRTAEWLADTPRASASVNVTAATLRDPTALDDFQVMLNNVGVDPARLMLEIPERLASDDPETFRSAATQIAAIGARVSIDGLSGDWPVMRTIRDVGVDAVKIDGLIVSRACKDELSELTVRSIVNAARLLGARVVAAWVEDEATFSLMESIGIEYGQGWLFGYPEPIGVDAAADG